MNEFARLRVVSQTRSGAFLDWGEPKDLYLPMEEQTRELAQGEWVVVYLFVDFTNRPAASMRVENYADADASRLRAGQRVRLWIVEETQLGFKALIEQRYLGVLYHSEIFQPLSPGRELLGYVKKIREDGKVDLILQAPGIQGRSEIGQRILEALECANGFLPLTEKSAPEDIYARFQVSKKQFKMALGGLYKQRLVSLDEDGVRLLP
ncbi:GntR family transcriptional regulator [bacterium]|nr:GntR family transcriptional regulator [bacterium]